MNKIISKPVILLHLASGIGNIVLATPLIQVLNRLGCHIDLILDPDYPQTVELFKDWSAVTIVPPESLLSGTYSAVIPAIPPFYWARFKKKYATVKNTIKRPPDSQFYANEQHYYLQFAEPLGWDGSYIPHISLPIVPTTINEVNPSTLVIAPGCKTGEMAYKRWPFLADLADRFEHVAIVGVKDDLYTSNGKSLQFGNHCRNFIDSLSLRQTVELMAGAGVVVANDSGLGHCAAAVGVNTIMLFGPTPSINLGALPSNVFSVRAGLFCEPCWFNNRFQRCGKKIDCLNSISVDRITDLINQLQIVDDDCTSR